MPPPKTYVNGFVNADITNVTYSSSGDDGNHTYPLTISTPASTTGCSCTIPKKTHYHNKNDFLTRYPNSVWNLNSVTIKNVTDHSTVSPPGTTSGGPSNHVINPEAPGNTGALASISVLVK